MEIIPNREITNQQEAVILVVTARMIGVNRKVSSSVVDKDVDADRNRLKVSKVILECDELDRVKKHIAHIREYIRSLSIPASWIKDGMYLIRVEAASQAHDRLLAMTAGNGSANTYCSCPPLNHLVQNLRQVYTLRVESERDRLGVLFNPADYPSVEEVERIGVTWRFISLAPASELQQVSSHLFEEERQKARQQWQEALEQARALLRLELKELIDHMVDRLKVEPGEKPRIFRNSLVHNMDEWLNNFEIRNIADDAELKRLVANAREIMTHVPSADALRTDEALRYDVAFRMQEIKNSLDQLVVEQPLRMITLE